jgi:hypothetical protein
MAISNRQQRTSNGAVRVPPPCGGPCIGCRSTLMTFVSTVPRTGAAPPGLAKSRPGQEQS